MKIDFANLNIQPMPNPKPLTTERVNVEENGAPSGYGYVRNAKVHPAAITERD